MSQLVASGTLYLALSSSDLRIGAGTTRRIDGGEVLVGAGKGSRFHELTRPTGHYGKLEALSQLRDGWDGRNAPRPNQMALTNAVRVLDGLATAEVGADRVVADADGGVAVYTFWDERGETYAAFHCTNDGEILLLRMGPNASALITEVDEGGVPAAAELVRLSRAAARAKP